MKASKFLSALALLLLASMIFVSCSNDDSEGTYVPPVNKVPSWQSDPEASAFIEEIGGCSETYTGTISSESYSVADDAAKAFVSNEIFAADDSIDIEYDIVSVKRDKALTKSEISSLGISDEYMQNATEVLKYTVTYTENEAQDDDASVMSLSSTYSNNSTVTVYIICYADLYKYFSPVVTDGNTLTKSYYDSIFDSEKYTNCTFTSSSEITLHADYLGGSIDVNMSMESTIMYDGDRIYLTETITSNNTSIMQNADLALYIEGTDNSLQCYVLQNGVWQRAYLSSIGNLFDFSSLDDLMPFAKSYLDHSYFTKTDYGCTIEKDNLTKYTSTVYNLALDQMIGAEVEKLECAGYVDYYVSDGVLSGTRSEITLDLTVYGVTYTEKIVARNICTNYGTTVIESPIQAAS